MRENGKVVAAIDIGTSRIKFIIKRFEKNLDESVLVSEKEMIHLGDDIGKNGEISTQTIKSVVNILNRYIVIAKSHNICAIQCIATEAFRSAKNAREAIEYIHQETGVELKVLSHAEEAELFFLAVSKDFPGETIAVADIGGGSVQITIGTDTKIYRTYLLKTGTVFLKNTFINSPKPRKSEIDAIQTYIYNALEKYDTKEYCPTRLVYGTTNVTDFLEGMNVDLRYSRRSAARHRRYCFREDLHILYKRILETPYKERGELYPKEPLFMHGADLALLNVLNICSTFGIDIIHPSNDNILSVILCELAKKE